MQDHDIVFHNGIAGITNEVSFGSGDPPCKAEVAGATKNWHLPVLVKYRIVPNHAETAAIVLAICEHKI